MDGVYNNKQILLPFIGINLKIAICKLNPDYTLKLNILKNLLEEKKYF